MPTKKTAQRLNRKSRIRKKVVGTVERPRLTVFRSLKHIYAQVIDDETGATLAQASSLDGEMREQIQALESAPAPEPPAEEAEGKGKGKKQKKVEPPPSRNVLIARKVGEVLAERCKAKQIEKVVFDRSGYKYHGRVRNLAEAARKAGLNF